jgi:Arp2/3 complex subunit p34-Arc
MVNSFRKPESIEVKIADFDAVTFHISTPEEKTKILISISLSCYADIKSQYALEDQLKSIYGDLVTDVEDGWDFSLLVDLENLGDNPGATHAGLGILSINILWYLFMMCSSAVFSANSADCCQVWCWAMLRPSFCRLGHTNQQSQMTPPHCCR